MNKRYLGDSVYVAFEDNCIILTTENGLPNDPSNRIVLDKSIYNGLDKFITDLSNEIKTKIINDFVTTILEPCNDPDCPIHGGMKENVN